ncbi:hypothetical protein CALVIDRAFT_539362 [Calocera viscosa TUFC12733]|uniref:Uncharacterized protein n=1 Tax=Calocera viscosa (strain TUFC12733) TaxID=1330018 RepID=A0A167JW72_CALVF|nr:hypothetical protein CALVIDRAFT_539362 [Calocera viscosa TUFC12733]
MAGLHIRSPVPIQPDHSLLVRVTPKPREPLPSSITNYSHAPPAQGRTSSALPFPDKNVFAR